MKDADSMPDTDPNRTLPPELEVSIPSSDQPEDEASEKAPKATLDLTEQVQAIEEETQAKSSSSSERPAGSGSPNRPRYVYD